MTNIIVETIKKESWTKNWSGNWGLLFGSLYGDIYTKGLKKLTGKYFHHNLVVFENGTSSNYLMLEELKEYCSYLVTLILNDNTKTEKWCDQVITNTDKIFSLMKNLDKRKSFSEKDYFDLQNARFIITTANFSIKKVIDYLPANLVEKNLELFSKVRVYTEPVYNETDRLLYKITNFLLKNKLSKNAISVLTKGELEKYFITGELPEQKSLDSRFMGCALFFNEKGKCHIFQGDGFKEIMSSITTKLNEREIKGMVAFRGKATGHVKIIKDPRTCDNFKEGDILVAGMTRPEYLSLMQKSAAFITDAGGLLSHAAIVAREMKKPCIVGTEVATKVLKDGDFVEVDAESGIVRILR